MNPMNRKMFRDPMASRQAAGILASSPELMAAAQRRQPVRMANGGTVNTQGNYLLAVQNAIQAGDKAALQELAKPINYGQAARTPDGKAAIALATKALAAPKAEGTVLDKLSSGISKVAEVDRNIYENTDQFLFGTDDRQSPLQSAARAVMSPLQSAANAIIGTPGAVARDVKTLVTPVSTATGMTPAEELAAYRPGTVPPSQGAMPASAPAPGAGAGAATKATPVTVTDTVGTTPDAAGSAGEDSSTPQTAGKSAAELLAEATARQKGETPAAATAGAGDTDAGTTGSGNITAAKVVLPESLKNLPEGGVERAPGQALTRGFEIGFNEADAAADKVDSVLNQNRPAKDVAKDNDAASGIDPNLSRSERVKQRVELYREMLGDEAVKDIRTDANYNLMMLGLRIASGQSENAISNIAQAGAAQLGEFGTAVGEETQAKVKEKRDINLMAIGDVNQEMATEAAAMNAAAEAEKDRQFKWDVNKSNQAFQAATAAQDNIWQNDRIQTQINASLKEAGMQIDAANLRQKNDAALRVALQNAQNENQVNLALANHNFAAEQAKEGRIFDLEKLGIAQAFAKDQGLSEQAFREKLAKLPGDTQKLYEQFLTPAQITELLTVDKTSKDRSKYKSSFISDVMVKGEAAINMEDSLVQELLNLPANQGKSEDELRAFVKNNDLVARKFSDLFDTVVWPTL